MLTRPIQRLLLSAADSHVRAIQEYVFAKDFYTQLNPEVSDSGLLPIFDYLLFGAAEGRDPHPLFSTKYYLDLNTDVRNAGCNPLLHYVRLGAGEGRDPHFLFDTDYYVSRYPDAKTALNPLLHFLAVGQREHRRTSEFFDPEFYRTTQIESCRGASGALMHYVQHGASAGHPPTVDFDPAYYMKRHPDVAAAGYDPFCHYVLFGMAEKREIRAPRLESSNPDAYLPVATTPDLSLPTINGEAIDIVIQMHTRSADARRCLESVVAAANKLPTRIVVINSPTENPGLAHYLQGLSAAGHAKVEFAASLKQAFSLHPENDVVLLHAGVQVFGNWIDRLATHAYSGRVATVSPFSNAATVCDYPQPGQGNTLPEEVSPASLDTALFAANAGRNSRIPASTVGCMYVRRDALNDVASEVNFWVNAMQNGWSNLLAADTFVYQSAAGPEVPALDAIFASHPLYQDHLQWLSAIDPANAFRIAATLYRLKNSHLPIRLNLFHGLGGGTLEHIREIEALTHNQMNWLSLTPNDDRSLRLCCERPGFEFSLVLDAAFETSLLLRIVEYLQLERVHVHHLLGFPIDVPKWLRTIGVEYEVTLHDYFFICPRSHLQDANGRYCGEISCRCRDISFGHGGYLDLLSWRATHGAFLSGAVRIIAPSADTAERMQRYFPWLDIIPAWHENCSARVQARALAESEPLKIAILGWLALHKGFLNLRDCVRLAAERNAPLEFVLIGDLNHETKDLASDLPASATITGQYGSEELPNLLSAQAPHLVWFPCQWPETFSYTLSACLANGLPVAVPNLGAFTERVDGRPWSWIMPWDTTPSAWLDFFERIRRENFLTGTSPKLPHTARTVDLDFYPGKLLQPPERNAFSSLSLQKRLHQSSKSSVLAIPVSFPHGQVQACGYIRIVQPLTHPGVAQNLSLHIVDIATALRLEADVIIIQRTAVSDPQLAVQLIDHCRRLNIRLVYEIDDDLFRLPSEHPEHAEYRVITRAAKLLARAADAVTVSTEALRQLLLRYNENVVLIPNYLDERLWFAPDRVHQQTSARRIRALYMGTSSHKPDLELLEEPVRLLKQKFDFELNVIGITDEPGQSPWFDCTRVPAHISGSYPNFVRWLTSLGPWHFGLAPLRESRFNTHKSAIKAYDYAALGLPTMASAVAPYDRVIENGKTGLLVPNTTDHWLDSLSILCESLDLRQRLAHEVRRRQRDWTLQANAAQIRSGWHKALFGLADSERPTASKLESKPVKAW